MSTKPKFSLDPDPTFKAIVLIPVPGKGDAPVEFIFKYRDADEYDALMDQWREGKVKDADAILDVACGWELPDAFDKASVEKMLKKYQGAAGVIFKKYIAELTGARLGN